MPFCLQIHLGLAHILIPTIFNLVAEVFWQEAVFTNNVFGNKFNVLAGRSDIGYFSQAAPQG